MIGIDITLAVILKLYFPLIMCILSIVLLVTIRKDNLISLTISFFKIFRISRPVKSAHATRFIVFLIGISWLGLYLLYDYSDLFPKRLHMEVFYDKEGLDECLSIYSDKELADLGIPNDYRAHQDLYYNSLDDELKKILEVGKFFTLSNAVVHSEGEVNYTIRKIRGIQNYYFESASGKLNHIAELPNKENVTFLTLFEKVNSPHDYLRYPLLDLFFKPVFILKNRYKQILADNYGAKKQVFHHILYGIHKVTLFPYPKFSNAVYLYYNEQYGSIPIAYTFYK